MPPINAIVPCAVKLFNRFSTLSHTLTLACSCFHRIFHRTFSRIIFPYAVLLGGPRFYVPRP